MMNGTQEKKGKANLSTANVNVSWFPIITGYALNGYASPTRGCIFFQMDKNATAMTEKLIFSVIICAESIIKPTNRTSNAWWLMKEVGLLDVWTFEPFQLCAHYMWPNSHATIYCHSFLPSFNLYHVIAVKLFFTSWQPPKLGHPLAPSIKMFQLCSLQINQ